MKTVYITGQMRSGTSLIASYLGQNRGCHVLVDQFRVATASAQAFGAAPQDYAAPLNLLDRLKLFRSFLNVTLWFARGGAASKVVAMKRIAPFQRYIARIRSPMEKPHVLEADIIDMPAFTNHLDFYETMMAHVLDPIEKTSVTVLGNKETRGEGFARARAACGGRCIEIIRDPRATLASFVERTRKDAAFKVRNDVEEVITLWRESFEAFQALDGALKLRYEDFVRDHAATVKRISDYLGVPLEAGLEPAINNSSFGDVGKGELSEAALDRWRQTADPELAGMITERLRPQIEALGYKC